MESVLPLPKDVCEEQWLIQELRTFKTGGKGPQGWPATFLPHSCGHHEAKLLLGPDNYEGVTGMTMPQGLSLMPQCHLYFVIN